MKIAIDLTTEEAAALLKFLLIAPYQSTPLEDAHGKVSHCAYAMNLNRVGPKKP